jgi:glycosyltransferase involved in cell wall biosynthesis
MLVDVLSATSGGGASRARELARTLPILGPQHAYLFVAQRATAEAIDRLAPTTLTARPRDGLNRPLRLAWEHTFLPQRLGRSFRPDVVFSPFNYLPTWWPDPAPRLAVLVSNLAPYSPELRRRYEGRERLRLDLLRRLSDKTLRRADRVFVLSRQAWELIDPRLLEGKTELIPMAPPTPPPISSVRLPAEPFFLVVGDLLRYKGVEVVLDALSLIVPRERPLVLVVGTMSDRPYVRMLERRREQLGLGERVRFLGAAPHEEVLALLRDSMACLMPSRFENQSRVPVEAFALDCPVVASDIPAFREAADHAASFFALDRPEELAEHMRRLIADPGLRERHVQRGRRLLVSLDPGSASQRILTGLEALAG